MESALDICLNHSLSPEEQFESLLNLGLDLEEIFEIALTASEYE